MTEIRPCSKKTHAQLVHEWDQLAEERHRQIISGEDLSFHHVVIPTTWRLLEGADRSVVLDIGSGTGEFTAELARASERVIAVEPSNASMTVARSVCDDLKNVQYVQTPIEGAASFLDQESVTAAVAVMTLMTAPDLRELARALRTLLRPGARFVATITHPCFWPKYWGYETKPWFCYQRETFIEAPFVISRRKTGIITTHIHRPLEQYFNVFIEEGFRLDAVAEPIPGQDVQILYPKPWEFPRFLGLRWEKVI